MLEMMKKRACDNNGAEKSRLAGKKKDYLRIFGLQEDGSDLGFGEWLVIKEGNQKPLDLKLKFQQIHDKFLIKVGFETSS
jgi:hypothetical protein